MNAAPDLHALLPGRHDILLPVGRMPDGGPLDVHITIVVGHDEGPCVVVTAGVHGDEYEGVHAVVELSRELQPDHLRGRVVLVPVANPPAFNVGTRLSPLDGVNLNRVFPGDATGSISERLAYTLWTKVIAAADLLIDLHSGGTRYLFEPQAGFYNTPTEQAERSLAMARAFGVPLLWELPGRSGVLSYEAQCAGVAAIGCEIGGNGRCEPEHVALAKRGVRQVLAFAEAIVPLAPVAEPTNIGVWRGDFALCPAAGLFIPAVRLNDHVRQGQVLYAVHNLRNEVVYQRVAEHDGLIGAMRVWGMIGVGEWDVALLRRVEQGSA